MSKFKMPTAYTILFCLIILVAAATWFVPAGQYAYEDDVPISGTYHETEQNPQGAGDIVLASFHGFYDAVDVCVFILMVGGFLGVVMRTGAVDAGVSNVIRLLGGREKWLIPIFLAAGYDTVVGIAVILLGAGAGVICSTVNPFATGIAAGFAGVSLGEGIVLRILMWVVFEVAAIWYVMAYAARVKKDPSASVVVNRGREVYHGKAENAPPLTGKRKVILAVFAITFLVMIYAVIPFDDMGLPLPTLGWWFPELSGLFLVAGILIGLIDRMEEAVIAEEFVSGASDLLGVAFIIGISRGITYLMNEGRITDTVLSWGEHALTGASSLAFILLVFLLYLPLSILIPSSSGLATLSIPIVAPLGKFAGISGSLVITAFQSASGLVNMITPTAAVVMGALALGHVSYDRWVKFVWKLIVVFAVLIAAFLALGALVSGL